MNHAPLPSTPGWQAETGAMFRLAGPLALANILQMLTYAVDVMFIARLGAEELAAAALATSLFGLILWAVQSLVGACAPIIASDLGRYRAARSPVLRPIRRTVRMALWLGVMAGTGAMAVCLCLGPLMRLTGQDPQIAVLASRYMVVLVWAVIPMVLASGLRQFVATLDRSLYATVITAVGIGINAFGNWLLVFGNLGMPALGLEGAAIATFVTALAIVGMYWAVIARDPVLARYRVFAGLLRPDWPRLAQIVRLGLPISLTVLAESGVFGAAAFLMGRVGAVELAAHTLALQIASLAFMVPMGVAQATTIRVGYFRGSSDAAGAGRAGWTGIVLGTGFMALTALAMLIAPRSLLAIYIDPAAPANAELAAVAVTFLAVAAAFQLFDGLQAVAAGALRGLQDTTVPMWIAIFSFWVPGFGLAAGLGLMTDLAGVGVWLGLATGLVCASALLVWRWSRRGRLALFTHAR